MQPTITTDGQGNVIIPSGAPTVVPAAEYMQTSNSRLTTIEGEIASLQAEASQLQANLTVAATAVSTVQALPAQQATP